MRNTEIGDRSEEVGVRRNTKYMRIGVLEEYKYIEPWSNGLAALHSVLLIQNTEGKRIAGDCTIGKNLAWCLLF